MTRLAFTKAQATGNDFVVVADPDGLLDLDAATIARLCDRRFGVGGDGLIRAVRSERIEAGRELVAAHPEAEWFMDYANADGSIAEMCGNGIRAFARFLTEHGLVALEDGEVLSVGTRAGVKRLRRAGEGFEVDLGRWRIGGGEPLVTAAGIDVARPGLGVDLGNPHVVVALSSPNELDALELHAAPRVEPVPPAGANIEFVVPHEPLVVGDLGRLRMRVHERGVGETLSCGTGVAATALAVRHWAGAGAPNRWQVDVPGGTLEVRMEHGRDGEHLLLAGPAELVYDGEIALH